MWQSSVEFRSVTSEGRSKKKQKESDQNRMVCRAYAWTAIIKHPGLVFRPTLTIYKQQRTDSSIWLCYIRVESMTKRRADE